MAILNGSNMWTSYFSRVKQCLKAFLVVFCFHRTLEDKCMPQESESTETDGDLPSPKLSQSSFTEQKVVQYCDFLRTFTQKSSHCQILK